MKTIAVTPIAPDENTPPGFVYRYMDSVDTVNLKPPYTNQSVGDE